MLSTRYGFTPLPTINELDFSQTSSQTSQSPKIRPNRSFHHKIVPTRPFHQEVTLRTSPQLENTNEKHVVRDDFKTSSSTHIGSAHHFHHELTPRQSPLAEKSSDNYSASDNYVTSGGFTPLYPSPVTPNTSFGSPILTNTPFYTKVTPYTSYYNEITPRPSPTFEKPIDEFFHIDFSQPACPSLIPTHESICEEYACEPTEIWEPDTAYDMHPSSIEGLQYEYHRLNRLLPPGHWVLRWMRQQLHTTWTLMLFNTTNTFFSRIRCPRCHQIPLVENSHAALSNHFMPASMLSVWRLLIIDSWALDPADVNAQSMWEIHRRFEQMEVIYWEEQEAGSGCGRFSWNGSRAEAPIA